MEAILRGAPHRRRNALTGEWLLVSPHRAARPWQGQVEIPPAEYRPPYVADCYLCPGNPRAGGVRNPDYRGTFVFDNDFPSLLDIEGASANPGPAGGPLDAEPVSGACRVVCFSPRHDLTLADMPPEGIEAVIDVWADETATLGRRYPWVQVFENKGPMMGCSNPHPHGQIWATSYLPKEALAEDARQREGLEQYGRPLLEVYAEIEAASGDRVVTANDDWLAVVPWWAMWPYETLVLPRFRVARMPELAPERRASLARLLSELLRGYDALFGVSFPYSMGWHGAPSGDAVGDAEPWQLHAHFYPPLLRSATVRKFMVGFEMLAEPQRDLTPEQAAEILRACQNRIHGGRA